MAVAISHMTMLINQAVWIANDHSINLEDLKDWAEGEDNPEKFATFLRRAKL